MRFTSKRPRAGQILVVDHPTLLVVVHWALHAALGDLGGGFVLLLCRLFG